MAIKLAQVIKFTSVTTERVIAGYSERNRDTDRNEIRSDRLVIDSSTARNNSWWSAGNDGAIQLEPNPFLLLKPPSMKRGNEPHTRPTNESTRHDSESLGNALRNRTFTRDNLQDDSIRILHTHTPAVNRLTRLGIARIIDVSDGPIGAEARSRRCGAPGSRVGKPGRCGHTLARTKFGTDG